MNLKKDVITIEGMSCGHCVKAVENAVGSIDGVIVADVNLEKKVLVVEYNADKVSIEKIEKVIEDEGYTVV